MALKYADTRSHEYLWWYMQQRRKKRQDSPIVYPEQIVAFYDANYNDGTELLTGGEFVWSYADRDTPLIVDGKIVCDTAFSDMFTGLVEEIVALTAQEYVLQVFGSGSATCSYGTATVDNPLIFTATVGHTTFTPTGITNWNLTEGAYVHNEVENGTSQASTAGTASGNGASISMVEYVGQAQPSVVDCYTDSGVVVGFDNVVTVISETSIFSEHIATANRSFVNHSAEIGVTYRFTCNADVAVYTYIKDEYGGVGVTVVQQSGASIDIEFTATSEEMSVLITDAGGHDYTLSDISIQKLIPVPQPKAIAINEALRGKTDGVELVDDTTATAIGIASRLSENTYEVSFDGAIASGEVQQPIATDVGDRIAFTYTVISNSTTNGTLYLSSSGYPSASVELDSTVGTHTDITLSDGVDLWRIINWSSASSGSIVVRIDSIQKLLPATCTLLTRATGVGSDDVLENINCVAVNDQIFSVCYYSNPDISVKAYDGTVTRTVTVAWSRDDDLIRLTEVSVDGTQFRVGYINATLIPEYTIADVTWGALTAFDGSFDPLDYLRFAFETTVPIYIQQVILSNLGGDAETLIEESKRFE